MNTSAATTCVNELPGSHCSLRPSAPLTPFHSDFRPDPRRENGDAVGSPGRPEKAQRFAQQPRQLGPLRMVLLPLLSDGVKPQKMRPICFRIRRSAQMGPTQSLHRLGNRGLTPGGLAIIPDGPNFVLHFRPRLVGIRPSLGGDLVQHFADARKPGALLNMAQNGCPHLIHSCIRFAGSITS